MSDFGQLVRRYREGCRLPETGKKLTQAGLAEALSRRLGLRGFSGQTVSNWERGKNLIGEREVVVVLLGILHEYGGLQTLRDAEKLLAAGDYRSLSAAEVKQINPNWQRPTDTLPDGSPWPTIEEQLALLPPPTYTKLVGFADDRLGQTAVGETAVSQLETLLLAKRGLNTVAIVGMGGLGKSALADFVARRLLEAGRFVRVVWLKMAEQTELASHVAETFVGATFVAETFVSVLHHALLPQQSVTLSHAQKRVQVRRLLQQPHLVVIDNLETAEATTAVLNTISSLGDKSRFLLTTRQQLAGSTGNAHIFSVPLLDTDAALRLLRQQAEQEGNGRLLAASENELVALCTAVGRHPQALRLLPRMGRALPLAQLQRSWEQGGVQAIEALYSKIYGAVWAGLMEAEQRLLTILPLVAETGGAAEQLQAASGLAAGDFWTALMGLERACLLLAQGTIHTSRYGLHSLTRQFLLRRWAAEGDWPETAVVANLAYWHQYLEDLDEAAWHKLDEERANLFRAVALSVELPQAAVTAEVKEQWLAISERVFRYVEQRGNGRLWLPILEAIISRFSVMSLSTCLLMSRLGSIYRMQHQLPKAIAMHEKALRLAQEFEEDRETKLLYLNLGHDYYIQNKYEKAIEYCQLAIQIFEPDSSEERETAVALNLLGLIARMQSRFSEAERYFQQASFIWQTLNNHPERARTLINLSKVYQAQGRNQEAINCFQESQEILSETSSELDRTLAYLSEGAFYFRLNDYAKAQKIFERIDLQFLEASGNLNYQALTLNNLGNLAFVFSDLEQAEKYLQHSLSIWQELDHKIELANTASRLGDVFLETDRFDAAQFHYEVTITLTSNLLTIERARTLNKEAVRDLQRLKQKRAGLH